MIFVYKDRIIQIEWSIFRGTSQVPEDFSRALVKLFLVGNYEKYAIPVTAEGGTLVAQMPQDLPDGAYSLEAIWVKNYNNLFPVRGTDTPSVGVKDIRYPIACHSSYGMMHPWDHRSNDRCLMRSRKEYVFAVTSYPGEETAVNQDGYVTIKISSAVATYGYDGLSAYEIAVMRGDFNGTEKDFLAKNIINNPDNEDLTIAKEGGYDVIKFADKEYNALNHSGLGRVYLRKNIVSSINKNILTQDMIKKTNTRYIIQYDYDLNGEEITIPEGCILDFQGGSFSNGVIIGDRTGIAGHPVYNVFNDTIIKGFNLSCLDIRWFGAVSDFISTDETGTDNSLFIKRALEASVNCAGVSILIEGRYRIGTTIETGYDINLIGRYNNNRTFVTDSDTYTDKVSLLYVDNCSAFKVIGRGLSTAKSANITVKNLYLIGSGTSSNSTFIEYSATGGPSRVGYISEVEVKGFNKFLYFYDNGNNPLGTLYGNLTIEKVVAYYNNQFIVSKASGDVVPTLCNLIIKDSNIEQNGVRAIDLENLFGANIIDNCILEGQHYPIRAVIINGSLEITNNYFEINEGDYLVNISGKAPKNCFVKYENNYKHNNVTSPLRFSGITLTGFDSMNNNPSQLNFSNCTIACDVFPYLTTDSFTSILNFNEPRYCNAIDSDENIRLLSFGNKRIESNILGTTVNSDKLYLVKAVTNLEVNEGDVLVIVLYKTSGSLQFAIYDSSGSPISNDNTVIMAGASRMVMLKMNINASSSGVYVYMQALSGDPCVGNGMIYKNPDAVSLHKLGIFPAGLLSNTVSPIYAKASDIGCNYFINNSEGTKGLYYSDGTDIRNSDGAPFSKEEIVPNFLQYHSFLRENKTYKVVGDLDLNGTQVIVPEGCTIDFSRGGTISNGTFSLTNTRLLPQGLNLREYILEGVSITGTYKEGQIVYDSAIKKMKLWNGTAWVNMDGTALE